MRQLTELSRLFFTIVFDGFFSFCGKIALEKHKSFVFFLNYFSSSSSEINSYLALPVAVSIWVTLDKLTKRQQLY